jgi:hypothetical protein
MQYVVSKIALKRRSELVEPPKKLKIHDSFLMNLGAAEFSSAFRTVHNFFYELLFDIAKDPIRFGLSGLEIEQMRGGTEESEARIAADWPFYLLFYLFACGKAANGVFIVDVPSFRRANKGTKTVKHCKNYLRIFSEYGFVFEGLNNYKIPNNAETFSIEFPDMPAVVDVLHLVAKKCYKYMAFNGFALFISWNYRLITQARDVMVLEGHEVLADGLKDKTEKEFVFLFHESMKKNGFVCKAVANHDGPIIRYFENEKQPIYLFEIAFDSIMTTQNYSLNLKLRIRDAGPCLEYLEQCPETVKDMFRQDFRQYSPECKSKQFCDKSLNYVYEGKERWHCACYGASFQGAPIIIDNIPHYIDLVKLGKTKAIKK